MIHLHVHSEYSLLDGVPKPAQLAAFAAKQGFPALALTDHGVLYGAIEFANACQEHNLMPIIGVEAYLCRRGQSIERRDYRYDQSPYHLLLLAANREGYRNLLRLVSIANTKGFYYHPRVDHILLREHAEGLICTSGCVSGEIARTFFEGRVDEARAALIWYREVFGDRFWVELQGHDIEKLKRYNAWLIEEARRLGIPIVATNDAHYLTPDDRLLYESLRRLRFLQENRDVPKDRPLEVTLDLCSEEALIEKLVGHGIDRQTAVEAVTNTTALVERYITPFVYKDKYHLPAVPSPHAAYTPETFFVTLAKIGFERRYAVPSNDDGRWEHDLVDGRMLEQCIVPLTGGEHPSQLPPHPAVRRFGASTLRARLNMEIETIRRMNFVDYMLIVWDIVRYAKSSDIWWNVRGSAAGSMVVYCLGLTRVEPVGAELYFERFLNPERVSMPDIDIDFPEDRRAEVIDYTVKRYGADKVAAIITFNTMGARAAIRETARLLDVDRKLVDRITALIPSRPDITLQVAIEESPALKALLEKDKTARSLVESAKAIEGKVRHVGTHAAGVVIADHPLHEYVPLHRIVGNASSDALDKMTQYEMAHLESIGLLKMDYLGLTLLTMMREACALIEKRHGVKLDLDSIPYDDPRIYRALGEGDVVGIFQVEGAGMRKVLMSMRPSCFEHVVAGIALFRPGPMQYIDRYIARMHGKEPVEYRHPDLKPILEETYGIIVYQEQIMRIARDLAGYTMGEADMIRKAVGKKQKDQLEKHREKFIGGAVKNGYPIEIAEAIWDDILYFARYGFNKAHAASFAMLTAQSMYLKQHYPLEFYTALINVESGDTEKMALILGDCARHGIRVLPPDVTKSEAKATIERTPNGEVIRLGLENVKFVGQSAEMILAERNRRAFEDVRDFLRRGGINRRTAQVLADIGALDGLPDAPWTGEQIAEIADRRGDDRQLSLFDEPVKVDAVAPSIAPVDIPKRRATAQVEYIGYPMSLLNGDSLERLEEYRLRQNIAHTSQTLEDKSFEGTGRAALYLTKVQPGAHPDLLQVEAQDLHGRVHFSLFLRTKGCQIDRLFPGAVIDGIFEQRVQGERRFLTCREVLRLFLPKSVTGGYEKNTLRAHVG